MQAIYKRMMSEALKSSALSLGSASPNPTVGAAAFDKSGQLIATGAHKIYGESHAESGLLAYCQEHNRLNEIDTLAITLEPCNHNGKTPPCTDFILKTSIKNIIIGINDPNPIAQGGLDRLKQHGINITSDVMNREAWHQMAGFLVRQKTSLPLIVLKIALDENGGMFPPTGIKTFTSYDSLCVSHSLRKLSDAIITGSETILTDNPLFTVRHLPDYPNKKRNLVIMDRRQRITDNILGKYSDLGFYPSISGELNQAIENLGKNGANIVLVEAGPSLSKAVFHQNLWDIMVVIQKNRNASDTLYAGQNLSKPLLNPLKLFSLSDFLPYDPKVSAICAKSNGKPADALRQFSNLGF